MALLVFAASPAILADDPGAVLRTLAAQDAALIEVGERLAMSGLPLCRDRGWASGMIIQTRVQYDSDYRAVAARELRLRNRPTIVFVRPGGAAARAGLIAGDEIVAVDGTATVVVTTGDATMAATEAALNLLDSGLADGAATLGILRDGQVRTSRLVGDAACRARFEVRDGADTNASADHLRVQVSSDLVDPNRRDEDLAPLVAHELSHVILRHDAALRRYRRGMLPGFGKGGRVLRASETAADRLSVYLLALAGYQPSDAIDFWTRFGRRKDQGILSDRTHPAWRDRVAVIRAEVARIDSLTAAGRPITPPADLLVALSG